MSLWQPPNALGYVRIYFRTRNAQHPVYRRANRAMCRYWIRQARRRSYIARAAAIRERADALGLRGPAQTEGNAE